MSRTSPPISPDRSGSMVTPRPLFVAGNSVANAAAIEDRSLWAAAIVTPGLNRPITSMMCIPRRSMPGNSASGVHRFAGDMTCASSGTTPRTVNDCVSRRIAFPISEGSPPNRVRQSPSLSTTVLGGVVLSVGRNVRPAIGFTPSTSKNCLVTCAPDTCSMVPSAAAMLRGKEIMPAIAWNVRLRAFQSSRLRGATPLRSKV